IRGGGHVLVGDQLQTVWLWRQALGVETPTATEGTRRLRRAFTERSADRPRGKPRPPEQVERRGRTALELSSAQYLKRARDARAWPTWQLQLLGTALDEEVAARIGRSPNAARLMREKHDIPNPTGHGWTDQEMGLLGRSECPGPPRGMRTNAVGTDRSGVC